MSKSQAEILVGARGWQFDQWHGSYYPQDLPDEWRFSFYSNEFRSVLVPVEYFDKYSADDWVDWADDTNEEFSFYIELDADFSWEDIVERVDVLTKQIKGFILVFRKDVDFGKTERLLSAASAVAPVCMIKDRACLIEERKLMAFRDQHKLNEVWCGETQDPQWGYHGAAVTCRTDTEDNAPLALRELLEKSLQHAGGHRQLAVFFTGSAPKIEDIRGAQTIADLLA